MIDRPHFKFTFADEEHEFEDVYKTYRNAFIAWSIRSFNCNRAEAIEIYQQVMIILYEHIINGKIQNVNSKLKTYLYGIAKNKFREKWRAEKALTSMDEVNCDALTEEEKEDNGAQIEAVKIAIQKLGDPCKAILECVYYHKMKSRDIAAALDYKNADTVKNLKYKCLRRLRSIYHEDSSGKQP